jgi:Na+-transporting NADH:ubiquinone oxidoreductase subunit NqrD
MAHGHLFAVHPQGNILLSGGATGPEGSLLIIPLLFIIALMMWLIWGQKKNAIKE